MTAPRSSFILHPSSFILAEPLLAGADRIALAVKRLIYRPGLTLMALAGIILTVGLLSSAGFFAQAVDRLVISQELADFSRQTGRPPFSMRIYAMPVAEAPLTLVNVEDLASHVGATFASEIGLPLTSARVSAESSAMMLWTATAEPSLLGVTNLVYYQDGEQHLDFVGEPLDKGRSGDLLDAWIHVAEAEKMGLNIGDSFTLNPSPGVTPVPIRIRGLWKGRGEKDSFWFTDPEMAFGQSLLVRRNDYIERVQPLVPSGVGFATWHIMLDETRLMPDRAAGYLSGMTRAMLVVRKYLPDARLDVSPLKPLEQFVNRSNTLTILLLGFNVPAFGFLLYFLVLTSAIISRWQRREISVLVSRGMSLASVLGLTVAEELLLFLPGVPLGIGLGLLIAQLMGKTTSFLVFEPRPPLPVSVLGVNLGLIGVALAVTMIARLWSAFEATRQSAVQEEREESRAPRVPRWQRFYLDLLLVPITAYAYYQLNERGTLAMLVRDRPSDIYRDPLMILVPALFVLTAAVLVMRLFPLLVAAMDVIADWTPWATPHLALRQLGRQSQAYINPLLLIIICLALGVYTFSLSASMDQWLVDRMYYQVGADLSFRPQPRDTGGSGGTGSASTDSGEPWVLPIEDFLTLPGVAGGTTVGEYSARANFAGRGSGTGRFLALDRLTFPQVAWFRDDFAAESLGGLMNLLAQQPDGILAPQKVLDLTKIRVGEQFQVSVDLGDGMSIQAPFTVVGTYNYFPTVYEDRITVIGNLDYLFSFSSMPMPHNIWLQLQPGAKGEDVLKEIRDMGVEPTQAGDVGALIATEKGKTERVGIFGTLSIGFLAAAAMALAGLLLNTYASFNLRLYEFTVLRALGLYRGQALTQVFLEYLFLTSYGAVAGAAVGIATSTLFSPFFRVTGMREIPLPPLVPVIAQDRIESFVAVFAVIMIVLELMVIAAAISGRRFRSLALRSQA